MCEFDQMVVGIAVQVLFVECGECLARDQMLENEFLEAVFVNRRNIHRWYDHSEL